VEISEIVPRLVSFIHVSDEADAKFFTRQRW